ncbi:hypothetical protein [Methylobacterium hispanicum]|uniref:hypothetical protein n=1 Tax=Methylobacterium hispanicum TaxID=270350 RepID=UPI002F2D1DE7
MADQPHRFRVIEGGDKPKPYRARKRGEAQPLTCRICETEKGHPGAVTMTVTLGQMVKDGRPYGGTKAIVCAHCLARGLVTILL